MTNLVMGFILDHELQKINRTIDKKIRTGQSYRSEAKIHKRILKKLNNLKKYKNLTAVL